MPDENDVLNAGPDACPDACPGAPIKAKKSSRPRVISVAASPSSHRLAVTTPDADKLCRDILTILSLELREDAPVIKGDHPKKTESMLRKLSEDDVWKSKREEIFDNVMVILSAQYYAVTERDSVPQGVSLLYAVIKEGVTGESIRGRTHSHKAVGYINSLAVLNNDLSLLCTWGKAGCLAMESLTRVKDYFLAHQYGLLNSVRNSDPKELKSLSKAGHFHRGVKSPEQYAAVENYHPVPIEFTPERPSQRDLELKLVLADFQARGERVKKGVSARGCLGDRFTAHEPPKVEPFRDVTNTLPPIHATVQALTAAGSGATFGRRCQPQQGILRSLSVSMPQAILDTPPLEILKMR